MLLDSPLVAHASSLTPSLDRLEAVFNPISNLDLSFVEEAPSRTSALVFQRMSAFFRSSTVITEAEFVLSCKKVVALLQLSEPKDVDLIMLVDLAEYAVITFVIRVFPLASKDIGITSSTLTPGLITLISLLDLIHAHLEEDGDFTVHLKLEAIRRLLLDHTEISLLLCRASSSLLIHTPLSNNIYQSNSLDEFRPSPNVLSSRSHPDVQLPSFPESLPSASLPVFQSPNLSFIDDLVPSQSSSILHSLDLSLSQSVTANLQENASGLLPGLEGILSSNLDLQLQILATSISQWPEVEMCQFETSLALPSPLFDFSNLPALSPRVAQPDEKILTHMIHSPEEHIASQVYAQSDVRQEVLTPISSPLSSPPRSPLADLSDNNQINSDVQHEQHRTASYSSMSSGSHCLPAASMHHELEDSRLQYVPDDTHLKFIPHDTVDPEMAALVIEKQSVIRRPRKLRSASNSLPTVRAVSRRIRTQGRAASVNISTPSVTLSLPLPKPLNAGEGEDVITSAFNRARNTKMRVGREATTTDSIHWEIDGPRPKPARGPRNRTSQQNPKFELNKENQTEMEAELPAHSEM